MAEKVNKVISENNSTTTDGFIINFRLGMDGHQGQEVGQPRVKPFESGAALKVKYDYKLDGDIGSIVGNVVQYKEAGKIQITVYNPRTGKLDTMA